AAGLILRRHEEDVGACLDEVREFVAVPKPQARAPRMPLDDFLQSTLDFLIAHSQQDERNILREHVIKNGNKKIEALLLFYPRNHRQQRPVAPGLVEAELLDHGILVRL